MNFINNKLEIPEAIGKAAKGKLIVAIATKFLLQWTRPLLVSFIAMLLREAAKNDNIELILEGVMSELDPDHNGQI